MIKKFLPVQEWHTVQNHSFHSTVNTIQYTYINHKTFVQKFRDEMNNFTPVYTVYTIVLYYKCNEESGNFSAQRPSIY